MNKGFSLFSNTANVVLMSFVTGNIPVKAYHKCLRFIQATWICFVKYISYLIKSCYPFPPGMDSFINENLIQCTDSPGHI